ncbi:glycoprotein [Prochlorococcus sp. AH-736-A13]|nr:glycoprotein [Prochlorococcus sp. AH-736-A13]
MLLKNHLIEVFKKASLENNFLLKENVVLKWVHRFGIDSLNDLLIYSSPQKENQHEEENQEDIFLIDEVHEENQEQTSLIDEVHEENQEQISLIDEVHEENQEQISLIDEVHEENQEQIKLELSKTFENIEETKMESNGLETPRSNEISSKNQNSNKINQFTETPKLPLPYIKNLRKWINNDKKAS